MDKLMKQQYSNSNKFNARIYLNARFGTNKYLWPVWIFDQIDNVRNAKLLEVGCGNGLLWKVNYNRIPENWDITISDYSEGMIEDAKKYLKDINVPIKYEVQNVEDIEFPDSSFDIVIANHMLYHVQDIEKALSEIRRVLKPNGVLYSTTVGINNMKEMKDLIKEFDTNSDYEDTLSDVIKNFSLENAELLLKKYFDKVSLNIYEDSLIITESEPLVNYYLSCNGLSADKIVLDINRSNEFKEFINKKIQANNSIFVSKDSGIFISRN